MALILALGVLMTLTALSTALLTGFHASMKQGNNRARQAQSLNIAEAGIEKALIELRLSSAFYTGEENTPLGNGAFTVAVTPSGPGRFTVESTGTQNDGPARRSHVTVDAALDSSGGVRVLRWEESHS
jgi:hypothetical protein